ncbi:transglutaminase family protein [Alteromonas aestuariivivens]|uniref:Transglutaminase family protein n=1 Tax=Alteromonas aestuariivivens TaxID=1938339 RepID=A0A3D8MDL7_9ALTE|nr:transglutaminase family protein [Alteromonas aestuariivivens]RDV28939.1 transglutaminase family protein [Alteromonas aestuariivivens]
MKRFKVIHQTIYEYSTPVELQVHTLRLRPREDHDQHIESSQLNINPHASLRWHRDAESNSVAIATFSEPTDRLVIESTTTVQKYDVLPHDFLISDFAVSFPFEYAQEDRITLMPYLRNESTGNNPEVDNWINRVYLQRQSIQTFELLLLLNQQIYKYIQYVKRDDEGVQSSSITLTTNKGSCRDLASLFIDVVRHLGFAARFVSGYVHTDSSGDLPETTHAWAEVFIPGAGWKGFDPTHGCLVGARHIAVAVSRLPELVPPVSGAFWGAPGSFLKVNVWTTDVS